MNIRKEYNRLHNLVFDYEYKFYITHKNSNYNLSKKMKRILKKYMQLSNMISKIYDDPNIKKRTDANTKIS